MGRLNKGILGGFSGVVGTVVGSNWNGIDYMRSKPARRSAASYSQAQRDQQQKFTRAVAFMQTLGNLTDITFHAYAVRQTGRNSAISYLLKNAITGSSPLFSIDYSKVLISRGNLLMPTGVTAVAGTASRVHFSWTNNGGDGKAKNNDRAVVVVHCPILNQSVYSITSATRSAETVSIEVAAFNGYTVHTWIGFLSDDWKLVANSVYTGQLVIA